jgi:hypothetical protein
MQLNKADKMRKNSFGPAAICAVLVVLFFADCSTDGGNDDSSPKEPQTWTLVSGIGSDVTLNKVAFGNNVFVATGRKGSGNTATGYAAWSSNGVTWTAASGTGIEALGTSNLHVSFENNVFIAYGGSGGQNPDKNWAKSSEGKTWTAIGSADTNFNAKSGAFGNGKYLIGGSGGRIAHSSDGTNWTTLQNTQTTFDVVSNGFINGMAFGNDKFVAGGGGGHVAWATDPTGTGQWNSVTQTETIFDQGWINALIFADFDGGRFVAVGGLDAGPGKAAYSKDGAAWTQTDAIQIGDSAMVTSIAYGGGVFVVADNKGNASYSTDGTIWTLITNTQFSSDTTAINSICYGNGKFVIVGAGGKIAYSTPE